jgi:hypothetical protein
MAACVMHCLAVKFRTVFRGTLAARRHRPVVALSIIETMIDVPIEVFGPVKPRSSPDEQAS